MKTSKKQARKMLTLKEVADRLGENYQTVKGWRRRGLFPGAVSVDTLRGPVWQIPESDVDSFQRPALGRPKGKKK